MTEKQKIGVLVKDAREKMNLSRRELAKKVDLTEQYIWKIEKNLAIPSAKVIVALARVFNESPVDWLKIAGYSPENVVETRADILAITNPCLVKTVDELLQIEISLPPQSEVWLGIGSSRVIDLYNLKVFNSILKNIKRGVIYRYFYYKEDHESAEKCNYLKNKIETQLRSYEAGHREGKGLINTHPVSFELRYSSPFSQPEKNEIYLALYRIFCNSFFESRGYVRIEAFDYEYRGELVELWVPLPPERVDSILNKLNKELKEEKK